MSNKTYWQSFGELKQSASFQESAKNEFQEPLLPVEELDGKGLLDAKSPRRDFLKYLGFSTAAATLAASCDMPVRNVVPYLQKPDNLIPGVANYYASTFVSEGDVVPVIVKQRDGRPIKIEGNENSALTSGGTSARTQASVLDLYDTTRLRHPAQNSGNEFKEIPTFDSVDKTIADKLAALAGKPAVLLTSTVNSPSTLQIISEFIAKYPGSRHVQYDAVSYSGMLLANEACYGKRAIPSYHFDKAKVIISLGADFLGTWLSPVEFSSQYAVNRKIDASKPEMSRHIQFESALSLTGSNADDRFTHKPSEKAAVALNILAKLGGAVSAPTIADKALNDGIKLAVDQLNAHKGAALVVSGSNDVNLQIIVNAINEAVGANGTTINWAATSNYRQGIDTDFVQLVNDMNAGAIGALFICNTNPAYTYGREKFEAAVKKVPLTVSFNATLDETTELVQYSIPGHHWLESWGDAEPKTGYYCMIQPTINPLFKTRAFQTSLLKWSGNPLEYEAYFKNFWTAKLADRGVDGYNIALQAGLVQPEQPAVAGAAFNAARLADAAAKAVAASPAGKHELVIYQKVSMGTGNQANNPWLQELPDPISKVTWDNYAMISPALAKELLDIDILNNQRQGDRYEVEPEKPTIKITANGAELELPVLIIPGLHAAVVAVALGYGRASKDAKNTKEYIGVSANGAGKNAYPLVRFDGTGFRYSSAAEVKKTGNVYAVAQTQVHGSSESRPVIYETSLKSFVADSKQVLDEPRHERAILLPYGGKDFVKDATIYPDFVKPGIKWGMSIDLNTCTGCSACVVACTAENNVSVVGKTQVMRAHEMHWLRIDRYFTGDVNNPDVVFQPMMCQHCDNAPCENVCPVAATNHSSEGLNQMTYNRCIGTRYCANNCPFKVRRFNWLDYNGSDSFEDNQNPLIGVDLDDVTTQMNDDLTRMVLNPDVTVRARGVIEKCSFCVQRLQETKLVAKKAEDHTLVRNVKTACMQACPTHAIQFGNVNDKESEVYKIREVEQVDRNFYVLEQLHVLPNVSYLAKIKNSDRHVTNEKEEHGGGHGEATPAHKAEKEHA